VNFCGYVVHCPHCNGLMRELAGPEGPVFLCDNAEQEFFDSYTPWRRFIRWILGKKDLHPNVRGGARMYEPHELTFPLPGFPVARVGQP